MYMSICTVAKKFIDDMNWRYERTIVYCSTVDTTDFPSKTMVANALDLKEDNTTVPPCFGDLGGKNNGSPCTSS